MVVKIAMQTSFYVHFAQSLQTIRQIGGAEAIDKQYK